MTKLIFEEGTYQILGACFEGYKEKGCGFLEGVYQECLALELADLSIPFTEQEKIALAYKGRRLSNHYVSDFVCYDKIIIEIKAVKELSDEHRAQTINYLKATGKELGLLINFGHYPKIQHERFINQKFPRSPRVP